ncbi:MAG TPA: helix-turn-helix domain-containing protein [Gemmatimonadaceae bacterium]|nr:helix-turn-helix domain-containing protein [Gemmatimonadaceae bacterium]
MTDTSRRDSPRQDATRGRLLALLREGTWTVDDLATRLEITDNAVRFHLASLEDAGTIRKAGVLRKEGAGKPADLFTLTPEAEESFSRAYAPVLAVLLAELRETMSTSQLVAFLRRAGTRLAKGLPRSTGSLSHRVTGAAELLNALGGVTAVEKSGNTYQIIGRACPLARAVEADHCVCAAVTALVAEVVDADVAERCDRSGRPRCHFEISSRRNS